VPLIAEGTPNHTAKDGFRRVIDAFYAALEEKERTLEQDAQTLADERVLQQAACEQKRAT